MKFFVLLCILTIVFGTGCASRNPVELEEITEPSRAITSDKWICTGVRDSEQWYCAPDELELVKLIRDLGVEEGNDVELTSLRELTPPQTVTVELTTLDSETPASSDIPPIVPQPEYENTQESREAPERTVTVAETAELVQPHKTTSDDKWEEAEPNELSVLQSSPGSWLVQVASFRTTERAETFENSNSAYTFETFKVEVNDTIFYTLILAETFDNSTAARNAAELLSLNHTTSKPWVRTVRSLKGVLVD